MKGRPSLPEAPRAGGASLGGAPGGGICLNSHGHQLLHGHTALAFLYSLAEPSTMSSSQVSTISPVAHLKSGPRSGRTKAREALPAEDAAR